MSRHRARLWCCEHCDWTGTDKDMLIAPNPFDPQYEICGCPDCREIECFEPLCDEPGCHETATCGTPTVDDYRNTCHIHRPGRTP